MDAQETPAIEIDENNNKNIELEKNNIIDKKIDIKEENNVLSKEIICSQCKESCFIKINDYNFNLYGCKNGHNIKKLSIEKFEKTQNIQNIKQKCEKCDKYNDKYYKCFTCNIYIC